MEYTLQEKERVKAQTKLLTVQFDGQNHYIIVFSEYETVIEDSNIIRFTPKDPKIYHIVNLYPGFQYTVQKGYYFYLARIRNGYDIPLTEMYSCFSSADNSPIILTYRTAGSAVYNIYSDSELQSNTMQIKPNNPPISPSAVTLPSTVYGGKLCLVSWSKSTDEDGNLEGYIVERSYDSGNSWTQIYKGTATNTSTSIPFGTKTVMFRVCAYDSYEAKSEYKVSANKNVINNVSPSTPPSISVPSDITPSINDKLSVSWGASTDTDGNLSGYQLERAWDGSTNWTQVYKGSSRSFTDTVPRGEHDKVKYRVRAYDSQNAYSGYRESVLRTITNNNIPEIVIETNLVEVTEPFSVTYVVSDDDHDPVTVVERLNDVGIRTLQATLNSPMTCEIDESKFIEMLNGENSIAIYCNDAYEGKNTKSIQFTKNVREVIFEGQKDLSGIDFRFLIFKLNGNLPEDCSVKFEILRNGEYTTILTSDKLVCPIILSNESVLHYRVSVIRGESDTQGNISQFIIGMI